MTGSNARPPLSDAYRARIEAIVDQAPPLSTATRAKLALLLTDQTPPVNPPQKGADDVPS